MKRLRITAAIVGGVLLSLGAATLIYQRERIEVVSLESLP